MMISFLTSCIQLYTRKGFLLKSENVRRHSKERRHRGEGKDHKSGRHGAKTFRRGRALAFLEMMNLKRSTLKQQLKTPERQSIHPI